MISNTSKVLTPAVTDGSRSPIASTSARSAARSTPRPHTPSGIGDGTVDHHLAVVQQLLPVLHVLGHRGLLLGRHGLGEIARGGISRNDGQLATLANARTAAIWLIRRRGSRDARRSALNPLRRLHIAASSAYAFSPSSSVQLEGVRLPHLLSADMRVGVAGAVPVQVRSASPQPRRSYSVIVVLSTSEPSGPLDPLLGAADRQLPAHVRLHRQRLDTSFERLAVQRASDAAWRNRADSERCRRPCTFGCAELGLSSYSSHLEVALLAEALLAELPILVGQLLDGVVQPGAVVRHRTETRRASSTRRRAGPPPCPCTRVCRTHTSTATAATSGRRRSDARDCRVVELHPLAGEVSSTSPGCDALTKLNGRPS